MKNLKIAVESSLVDEFVTEYQTVPLCETDFTDVAAVVVTLERAAKTSDTIKETGLNIPVFIGVHPGEELPEGMFQNVSGIIRIGHRNEVYYGRQIAAAADAYTESLYPPFFKALREYVNHGYAEFDCPGHQGGQFFASHPLGREFFNFYGETIFRSDICNADVKLGDLLIHEGPALEAQKNAAKIYGADKTYFVLNGTSTSNKVVTSALLAKDDIILFDRNNHKSINIGALTIAGARPVYLETSRNPFGFIGGIHSHCFEEKYIRDAIREVAPERADLPRPIRLAAIQLGTYDGTIYNAKQVIERIGHLCDYILFDSAWVGYEQFIPMMQASSPMLLELGENDPGIIVTQSVHKQQAGFSQTSQIHKKDHHIKGQQRYVTHKRLNNAYMIHASTSPFYALFAALDVNAQMQKGEAGRALWRQCVKNGIEARKLILRNCQHIRPFVPTSVDGRPWQDHDTEQMADDLRFFKFEPGEKWHSFEGYAKDQYFVDPCKLMLTTPGIDAQSGEYGNFGVQATILANYLRENGVIPEKCDLNSILFLLTPADNLAKLQHLISYLVQFEKHLEQDTPMSEVLPSIYNAHKCAYEGFTIRQLCQKMHDFYKKRNVKELQKQMFLKKHFPRQEMTPWDANAELVHNNVELVPLSKIKGRVAAEGALPYPPGLLCVVPGEVWEGPVLEYFHALEEGINELPGFEPEIQGVYLQDEPDGSRRAYGYVMKKT